MAGPEINIKIGGDSSGAQKAIGDVGKTADIVEGDLKQMGRALEQSFAQAIQAGREITPAMQESLAAFVAMEKAADEAGRAASAMFEEARTSAAGLDDALSESAAAFQAMEAEAEAVGNAFQAMEAQETADALAQMEANAEGASHGFKSANEELADYQSVMESIVRTSIEAGEEIPESVRAQVEEYAALEHQARQVDEAVSKAFQDARQEAEKARKPVEGFFDSFVRFADRDVGDLIGGPIRKIGHGIQLMYGAAKGAFQSLAGETMQYADTVWTLHQRTGVATDTLQRWGFAAEQNESSLEGVGQALKFLSKNVSEANRGSQEGIELFKRYGIELRDAFGKPRPIQDILSEVADAMARMSDGGERQTMAMALLGRSGVELVPLLSQGSKAIKELGDQAERTGNVLSRDTIKAVDDYGDQMKVLTGIQHRMASASISFFLPALKDIAAGLELVTSKSAAAGEAQGAFVDRLFGVEDVAKLQQDMVNAAWSAGWENMDEETRQLAMAALRRQALLQGLPAAFQADIDALAKVGFKGALAFADANIESLFRDLELAEKHRLDTMIPGIESQIKALTNLQNAYLDQKEVLRDTSLTAEEQITALERLKGQYEGSRQAVEMFSEAIVAARERMSSASANYMQVLSQQLKPDEGVDVYLKSLELAMQKTMVELAKIGPEAAKQSEVALTSLIEQRIAFLKESGLFTEREIQEQLTAMAAVLKQYGENELAAERIIAAEKKKIIEKNVDDTLALYEEMGKKRMEDAKKEAAARRSEFDSIRSDETKSTSERIAAMRLVVQAAKEGSDERKKFEKEIADFAISEARRVASDTSLKFSDRLGQLEAQKAAWSDITEGMTAYADKLKVVAAIEKEQANIRFAMFKEEKDSAFRRIDDIKASEERGLEMKLAYLQKYEGAYAGHAERRKEFEREVFDLQMALRDARLAALNQEFDQEEAHADGKLKSALARAKAEQAAREARGFDTTNIDKKVADIEAQLFKEREADKLRQLQRDKRLSQDDRREGLEQFLKDELAKGEISKSVRRKIEKQLAEIERQRRESEFEAAKKAGTTKATTMEEFLAEQAKAAQDARDATEALAKEQAAAAGVAKKAADKAQEAAEFAGIQRTKQITLLADILAAIRQLKLECECKVTVVCGCPEGSGGGKPRQIETPTPTPGLRELGTEMSMPGPTKQAQKFKETLDAAKKSKEDLAKNIKDEFAVSKPGNALYSLGKAADGAQGIADAMAEAAGNAGGMFKGIQLGTDEGKDGDGEDGGGGQVSSEGGSGGDAADGGKGGAGGKGSKSSGGGGGAGGAGGKGGDAKVTISGPGGGMTGLSNAGFVGLNALRERQKIAQETQADLWRMAVQDPMLMARLFPGGSGGDAFVNPRTMGGGTTPTGTGTSARIAPRTPTTPTTGGGLFVPRTRIDDDDPVRTRVVPDPKQEAFDLARYKGGLATTKKVEEIARLIYGVTSGGAVKTIDQGGLYPPGDPRSKTGILSPTINISLAGANISSEQDAKTIATALGREVQTALRMPYMRAV